MPYLLYRNEWYNYKIINISIMIIIVLELSSKPSIFLFSNNSRAVSKELIFISCSSFSFLLAGRNGFNEWRRVFLLVFSEEFIFSKRLLIFKISSKFISKSGMWDGTWISWFWEAWAFSHLLSLELELLGIIVFISMFFSFKISEKFLIKF